jgi:ADP-ribosylglycohydrolase
VVICTGAACAATEKRISREDLRDKIDGFWLGQLAGNYMGLPFENIYREEPVPLLVDRYYDAGAPEHLKVHRSEHRGNLPIINAWLEGAVSDDDTDIEFVTLYAVEKYGLDLTYPEITDMWKKHINTKIWVANRRARDLMEEGLVAPETGKKENNEHWFQIDPQLVNEIWSAFYPGMPDKAVERADWGARITNDDWGIHPTLFYAAILSNAFFERDMQKMVEDALTYIPKDSPFYAGAMDVLVWHKEHKDWRDTRQEIHNKYYRCVFRGEALPVSVVSSLNNGLCGMMALLYGEGEFLKTVGIAVSAGYDCDNQAATCGGIIGILNGRAGIPDKLLYKFGRRTFKEPFNNRYVNVTRDGLPIRTPISEIVDRILAVSEKAILTNSGRKVERNGRTVYIVKSE